MGELDNEAEVTIWMDLQPTSLAPEAFSSSFYFHVCVSQGLLLGYSEALEPKNPLR